MVPAPAGNVDWNEPAAARFRAAMNDDFNTPEAVAVLFDLANEVNRAQSSNAATLLKVLGAVLGLLQRDPMDFLQRGSYVLVAEPGHYQITGGEATLVVGYTSDRIEELMGQREAARKAKNFTESDRIRDELLAAGIVLEDGPEGTTWRRK
jgi:cysteinyl-tRNA synthetase